MNSSIYLAPHHIEIIGYCAAFLTTIAFLPQAIQSWRTRDLTGISLGMYSLFTAGVGLWLVYGLIIEKWPLILANALTFALALSILLLKLGHTSRHQK
jgi:MtN3 and saliva related transmembrane protein